MLCSEFQDLLPRCIFCPVRVSVGPTSRLRSLLILELIFNAFSVHFNCPHNYTSNWSPYSLASPSERKVKVEKVRRNAESWIPHTSINSSHQVQAGWRKKEKKTEKLNYKTPQDHIQSKYVSQVFSQSTWKDFVLFFIFYSSIPCTHNLENGKNAAVYRFFSSKFSERIIC